MVRLRKTVATLGVFVLVPLLAACPKKEVPAAPDAYVAPIEVVDAAPLDLATLIDDGGADAAQDASVVHRAPGPVVNQNQIRAKQCCAALRSQAKTMGASPEANIVTGLAMQCDVVAAQVSPSAGAQAPELAPLRAMLQGKTIPPVCQGL